GGNCFRSAMTYASCPAMARSRLSAMNAWPIRSSARRRWRNGGPKRNATRSLKSERCNLVFSVTRSYTPGHEPNSPHYPTLLEGRAVGAFLRSLDVLRLAHPGIPNFDELNERLYAATGWTVVAVPGLVPDEVFHRHLSQRRFPAGNFIRTPEQLGYLQEPDV